MNNASVPTWLITGCSSGFGRTLASAVLARGENVVLTARDTSSLADLVDKYSDHAIAVNLDVTKPGDPARAITQAEETFGSLDVLVNNAGFGLIGAVEETSPDEYRPLFETNVFGLIEMTRAALPALRRSKRARIVQFSSTLGMCGRAGFGLYSASKFAVEGLSEALSAEVEPLGISVTLVEPGAFRTDFLGRSIATAAQRIDAYAETAGAVRAGISRNDGTQAGDPQRGVDVIIRAVDSERPPLRLALGADAYRNNRGKIARAIEDYNSWEAEAVDTAFRP
ncbi:oxidoreductase [Paraburkholderia caribensis]|uniref:oxidoreductase n=1 Tax=Paraburkholderia TaxID=1822464 RepID=UPI001CAAA256|nr:oxidoreductase [Paraburkholderia caribensis]BEU25642.1 oxidoreductase [Paraburkholderia sp. 22B1P]CAG9262433.1 3-oxoacyl-(acyl-carrier-protein) reductase FabG [Paraburkholderia caribensis]